MRKIHQAIKKGDKWVRRTKWELDVEDYIGILVLSLVVGYVLIRTFIG
jgi:hypothetical protein